MLNKKETILLVVVVCVILALGLGLGIGLGRKKHNGSPQQPVTTLQETQSQLDMIRNKKPLSGKELVNLVSGNTMIGLTKNNNLYILYFKSNKTVYMYVHNKKYLGKWNVNGNYITSQWPTYKLDTYILQYYHVLDNVYLPYNINDGCCPQNTFCPAFIVLKGKVDFKTKNL